MKLRDRVLERENRRWDEALGLDTGGWLVPDEWTTVGDAADGFPYAATHVRLARALLRELRPLAPGATFLDLGSGKGRMPLLAAELPFAEIIGVEYSRVLHEIAVANLAASNARGDAQSKPRSLLMDVRELTFPTTPLVIYLNNPFPEPLMHHVLANLSSSYDHLPRPLALIYQQLRHEDPEHATRNRELINALPFLSSWPIQLQGLLDRALLHPYVLNGFLSPENQFARATND